MLVSWSEGARLMYPDLLTARVTAEAVDVQTGAVGPTLATQDVIVPPPTVSALSVVSVSASPTGSATWQVDVATTPPLPLLQDDEPSLALILTANNGGRERYVVRPRAPSPGAAPVARFTVGGAARLAAAPNDFVGQQAYLVQGFTTTVAFPNSGDDSPRADDRERASIRDRFDAEPVRRRRADCRSQRRQPASSAASVDDRALHRAAAAGPADPRNSHPDPRSAPTSLTTRRTSMAAPV